MSETHVIIVIGPLEQALSREEGMARVGAHVALWGCIKCMHCIEACESVAQRLSEPELTREKVDCE